jgi:hypothetical protein
MVTSCKACQFHAKQIHTPAQALQMIPSSWPFAVWGVDILGPFPSAVGGYRFLFVAMKGKYALGPFLSILVIKCKHKCLNVKICPWMNKVQITS